MTTSNYDDLLEMYDELHSQVEELVTGRTNLPSKLIESESEQFRILEQENSTLNNRISALQDDVDRLSNMVGNLKNILHQVANEGDLSRLKPFSILMDAKDAQFLEVMILLIQKRYCIQLPRITPAVEPKILNEVPSKTDDTSKRPVVIPPLLLKSSELREKIKKAKLIVSVPN